MSNVISIAQFLSDKTEKPKSESDDLGPFPNTMAELDRLHLKLKKMLSELQELSQE